MARIKQPASVHANSSSTLLLALMALLVFGVLLVWRNAALYPTVFADEYSYSKFARLLPLRQAEIPSYAYLFAYGITNSCGDAFLQCARILNVLFFLGAAPFIYLVARSVAPPFLAAAACALAIAGPINSYSAYFMPESVYFFGFWVFCWYFLRLDSGAAPVSWLISGCILGATALIKPHPIFFVPGVIAYLAYICTLQGGHWPRRLANAGAAFIIGLCSVKLVGGYLLAGAPGLTLFGSMYSGAAQSSLSRLADYPQFISYVVLAARGHLLALTFVFAIPLALIVGTLVQRGLKLGDAQSIPFRLDAVSFFTLIVVLNLLCVAALFTASIAGAGVYELPNRLHMRYYNFALPLFYIVAAGFIAQTGRTIPDTLRYVFGAAMAAIIVFILYDRFGAYELNYIDSPEVAGLMHSRFLFMTFAILLLGSVVFWVIRCQLGLRMYFYIALPFFVLVSSLLVSAEQRQRMTPDVFDNAGIIAKRYLGQAGTPKLSVIGSQEAGLYRALFHIDSSDANLVSLPPGVTFDARKLPSGKEWLLVIGNHPIQREGDFFELRYEGFRLARIETTADVDFTKSGWPGVVRRVAGLSQVERWGTWSNGNKVEIEFEAPLPERFSLDVVAQAFGPNAGKSFIARAGSGFATFVLNAGAAQLVRLSLHNPERSRLLTIDIPSSISPRSLGLSNDGRALGLGLVELKIAR